MKHQHVTYDYMAHGYCFSWEPGLVWLHVVSDIIIGVAYYSIPLALFYVVYKRRDLPFYRMFVLFAAFILSCGTTHFFAAYTVFVPAYWLEGYVKAFTAIVSAISALLFIPLLPKVITMPSLSRTLSENEDLTRQLQGKIEELQETTGHLEMVNHELQVSESRFRAIFDTTYDAIFVHEVPSGSIIDVNQTACDLYGYTRQEMVNLTIEDLSSGISPYIQATALEWIQRAMAGKPQSFEWQAKDRNGGTFWVEANMKRATIGGSERVLVGVRDITERKSMADSLRKAKEYTDKIIQSANVIIICLNADGDVTLLNRTAEALLGYTREEIERKGFKMFLPPDVVPAVEAEFRRLITEGKPGTFENPIISKSGERRIISWRNSPITENGDIIGTISFGIDITEHRKTEAQLVHAQKMEAIGTLAGGIAHDFNNILTTIIGFGSLLTMRLSENDPNRARVEKILKAAERATALTQGLLAYSRKEAIELRTVDLNEIVVKFDHFVAKIIGEDIELNIVTSDVRLVILADVGQIEQVLMNLAVNARDAMPAGGSLQIRVEETDIDTGFIARHGYGREGRYALLTVIDTGTGMDAVTQEHIFEPYFTTKDVGKGTGLGLPIVYGIIKQHHGFIDVCSELGIGTTFRVYLPLTDLAKDNGHIELSSIARGEGELILIAEDNEEIRNLLRHLLTESGYRVMEAVDGVEAVDLVRRHSDEISLLLLDVIMPRKNGKETFDEIRAINDDIKVLFMSGYTADIISQAGIYTDGLEFISKPFTPDVLFRKIRSVLDGSV